MDCVHRHLSERTFQRKPRIPDRMKPNSLCLLTKRRAGVQEANRRIIGTFMVGVDFFGADCRSGTVAHPVHRVALRPEKGLAFWPILRGTLKNSAGEKRL